MKIEIKIYPIMEGEFVKFQYSFRLVGNGHQESHHRTSSLLGLGSDIAQDLAAAFLRIVEHAAEVSLRRQKEDEPAEHQPPE